MQLIRTIWTILVGDHPGTIPVEFGQNIVSGSREDVVWTFPYKIQCKNVKTPLVGDHPGIIPVKFGQNPMSGFRGEDVKVKKFTHDGQRRTTDKGRSQ